MVFCPFSAVSPEGAATTLSSSPPFFASLSAFFVVPAESDGFDEILVAEDGFLTYFTLDFDFDFSSMCETDTGVSSLLCPLSSVSAAEAAPFNGSRSARYVSGALSHFAIISSICFRTSSAGLTHFFTYTGKSSSPYLTSNIRVIGCQYSFSGSRAVESAASRPLQVMIKLARR